MEEVDWKSAPVSMEGSTAFRQEVGKNGLLKFYGNFNDSEFSLRRHDIDDANKTQLYALKNMYERGLDMTPYNFGFRFSNW